MGFRNFPVFMPPDNCPSLRLNKGEQAEISALNEKMEELIIKKLDLIRSSARRQGLTSDNLNDLRSENGNPFIEEKVGDKGFGRNGYRIAVTKKEAGKIRETAYLCRNSEGDGCGWVRGNPRIENYNDIGVLSGSAGVNYYCKICGRFIGKEALIMS